MITVILCTYNRCTYLETALNSVAASEMPGSIEWEVLVVDNNSKDSTREVVERACALHPGRFRYFFEPKPGKSNALNSGIREARGEILAFMDDDVTVDPAWLQNLTSSLLNEEWAGAGGRILPERGFTPPPWLALTGRFAMGGILALFEPGEQAGALELPPYGTNMAFHRKLFEKYGGFRTDLGPTPGSEIRNEDTEFGQRLMDSGERLRYEPAAIVYHVIPRSRVRKRYFLRWWFDYGRAGIRVKAMRPDVWGIPRHYISISNRIFHLVPQGIMRWLRTEEPQERFCYLCWVFGTFGEIVEIYRRGTNRTKTSGQLHPQSAKQETRI